MKIIELDCTDSTNDYLKRMNFCEDVAVTARRQSGGKGTKGRSFLSDEGGLYLSVQRVYADKPASRAFEIMVNACAAVCVTLENLGLNPVIRWANDVLVSGKKISGTLIENTLSSGHIVRSIVGIGINVYNRLPPELGAIATSIFEESGKKFSVPFVRGLLMENIEKCFSVKNYKKYINWFGKKIQLNYGDHSEFVTALDISEDGRLICSRGEEKFSVSAAEVSLRI